MGLCCNMGGKKKDPNAPKRPMSAYFFFLGDKRAEVKAANPEYKIGDIGKAIGKMWKELDASAKAPYEKKAEIAKKKYNDDMEAYKNARGVILLMQILQVHQFYQICK